MRDTQLEFPVLSMPVIQRLRFLTSRWEARSFVLAKDACICNFVLPPGSHPRLQLEAKPAHLSSPPPSSSLLLPPGAKICCRRLKCHPLQLNYSVPVQLCFPGPVFGLKRLDLTSRCSRSRRPSQH